MLSRHDKDPCCSAAVGFADPGLGCCPTECCPPPKEGAEEEKGCCAGDKAEKPCCPADKAEEKPKEEEEPAGCCSGDKAGDGCCAAEAAEEESEEEAAGCCSGDKADDGCCSAEAAEEESEEEAAGCCSGDKADDGCCAAEAAEEESEEDEAAGCCSGDKADDGCCSGEAAEEESEEEAAGCCSGDKADDGCCSGEAAVEPKAEATGCCSGDKVEEEEAKEEATGCCSGDAAATGCCAGEAFVDSSDDDEEEELATGCCSSDAAATGGCSGDTATATAKVEAKPAAAAADACCSGGSCSKTAPAVPQPKEDACCSGGACSAPSDDAPGPRPSGSSAPFKAPVTAVGAAAMARDGGYQPLDGGDTCCAPGGACSSKGSTGNGKPIGGASGGAEGGEKAPLLGKPSMALKARWARIAAFLAWASILWNVAEGAAGVYAGIRGHQVAVLAFGAQSGIEVISSIVVLWRLGGWQAIEKERRGTRFVGVLLVLLGLASCAYAAFRLAEHKEPSSTFLGLVVSGSSVLLMLAFWRAKHRAAEVIGSAILEADARCNMACMMLGVIVLADSLLWYLWGCHHSRDRGETCPIWWVDSAATIAVGLIFARDGVRAISASYSSAFAGGCGCCSPA